MFAGHHELRRQTTNVLLVLRRMLGTGASKEVLEALLWAWRTRAETCRQFPEAEKPLAWGLAYEGQIMAFKSRGVQLNRVAPIPLITEGVNVLKAKRPQCVFKDGWDLDMWKSHRRGGPLPACSNGSIMSGVHLTGENFGPPPGLGLMVDHDCFVFDFDSAKSHKDFTSRFPEDFARAPMMLSGLMKAPCKRGAHYWFLYPSHLTTALHTQTSTFPSWLGGDKQPELDIIAGSKRGVQSVVSVEPSPGKKWVRWLGDTPPRFPSAGLLKELLRNSQGEQIQVQSSRGDAKVAIEQQNKRLYSSYQISEMFELLCRMQASALRWKIDGHSETMQIGFAACNVSNGDPRAKQLFVELAMTGRRKDGSLKTRHVRDELGNVVLDESWLDDKWLKSNDGSPSVGLTRLRELCDVVDRDCVALSPPLLGFARRRSRASFEAVDRAANLAVARALGLATAASAQLRGLACFELVGRDELQVFWVTDNKVVRGVEMFSTQPVIRRFELLNSKTLREHPAVSVCEASGCLAAVATLAYQRAAQDVTGS
jgi:hypothetical protein